MQKTEDGWSPYKYWLNHRFFTEWVTKLLFFFLWGCWRANCRMHTSWDFFQAPPIALRTSKSHYYGNRQKTIPKKEKLTILEFCSGKSWVILIELITLNNYITYAEFFMEYSGKDTFHVAVIISIQRTTTSNSTHISLHFPTCNKLYLFKPIRKGERGCCCISIS